MASESMSLQPAPLLEPTEGNETDARLFFSHLLLILIQSLQTVFLNQSLQSVFLIRRLQSMHLDPSFQSVLLDPSLANQQQVQ